MTGENGETKKMMGRRRIGDGILQITGVLPNFGLVYCLYLLQGVQAGKKKAQI